MKTLAKLVIMLLYPLNFALADPVAKPVQWSKYYEDPQGHYVRYYNKSSAKQDGRGNISVEVMTDTPSPSCSGSLGYEDPVTGLRSFCYFSFITDSKVDCKNNTYLMQKRRLYVEHMAQGKPKSFEDFDYGWRAISNQFPEDSVLAKIVCKR